MQSIRKRTIVVLGVAAALLAGATMAVEAQSPTPVKVAYLRAPPMIPHWHADKTGIFKKHGLAPEIVTVNNGPAVAAAVASGSVDIGWAGTVPIINARAQNQPFKIISSGGFESSPDGFLTYIVASERSGVKSIADLKGKTFLMNAVGAVCELQMRDHFAAAGIKFEDVKTIVAPFPQFQATLELGNADAACPIEPFLTSMRLGGKIKPIVLAKGFIHGMDKLGPISANAYFVTEAWLAKNAKVAELFRMAIEESHADLLKNPRAWAKYLVDEFKMPPDHAAQVPAEIVKVSLAPQAAHFQPLIEAMVKAGMLKAPVKTDDLLYVRKK